MEMAVSCSDLDFLGANIAFYKEDCWYRVNRMKKLFSSIVGNLLSLADKHIFSGF